MKEEGIFFKCNANVGTDISVHDLLREFHAIVLTGGSTIPRDLNIPGRELKGIHFAMDFLRQQNKRVAEKNIDEETISAKNKKIIVIGGGDTGSDCVGTSNRQKARSVTQFELLPMPPQDRTDYMPWPTYPMLLKTTSSHEEGVNRHWAIATKEFMGDGKGNLKALKIVTLEWEFSSDKKPAKFIEVPDSETEISLRTCVAGYGICSSPAYRPFGANRGRS